MKAYELVNKDKFSVLVDGKVIDLDEEINEKNGREIIGFNNDLGKEIYWHTSAHILAQAVLRLFPKTELGFGPAIEEGFYYDFIPLENFTPDDLVKIENEMKKIIKENIKIIKEIKTKSEIIEILKSKQQNLKVEAIEGLEGELSLYKQDDFFDLCRGPHLRSTGDIGVVKVLTVAASYWKGDEKNKSMQRIYGISFPSNKELKIYLKKIEEAKKRDHRKIGKMLDLFSQYEEAGAGLVYWHSAGTIIRQEIEELWKREHKRRGYDLVITPHIARSNLWKISGHLDYYSENMYLLEDGEYVLKPMNCPEHILIFKNKQISYRDLPYKIAEMGTVYRKERSGVLHGMLRVRGFTQDDAHIFCSTLQIEQEIINVLELTLGWIKRFDYKDFVIELSLRDPNNKSKYAGDDIQWEKAEKSLINALNKKELPFKRMEGEAVFYGPKIDFQIKDAIGRKWQGTTIQLDFNLPKRFNLNFINSLGKEEPVVMIHRAIMGSVERFVGGLIEHYAGNFPLWLAPEQVKIIPITENQIKFSDEIKNILLDSDIRCKVDKRSEKIGYKIREAEKSRIPYMVIIGEKEEKENMISIRKHGGKSLGILKVDDFKNLCLDELQKSRKQLD